MAKFYTLLLFACSSMASFGQNSNRKSLEDSTQQLQNVEIVGRHETDYKNADTFIGSKLATLLKGLPQKYNYQTNGKPAALTSSNASA